MCNLSELFENRRSIYNIGKSDSIFNDDIIKIVENCITLCPTAFNCQSSRVVLLFEKHNAIFWNMVSDNLKKIVPAENFSKTAEKMISFQNGIGTILFFDDEDITNRMKQKFQLYAHNFSIWAQQSNAMLQYMVWLALAEKKIGASLQHYNEIIQDEINKKFQLPKSWKVICQMPFGIITEAPTKKEIGDVNKMIKILY